MEEITANGGRDTTKAINTDEFNSRSCVYWRTCWHINEGLRCRVYTNPESDCYIPVSELISRQKLMEWIDDGIDGNTRYLPMFKSHPVVSHEIEYGTATLKSVRDAVIAGEFAL